jgi:hypothetical protein
VTGSDFAIRILAHQEGLSIMGNAANIIEFESRYAADFKQLNLESQVRHFPHVSG